MKKLSSHVKVPLLLLFLGIVVLSTGIPRKASADGGAFPTVTPTATITPSPTIVPTDTPTIIPTLTPTVTPFPLQPDLQQQPIQATPVPPARPSAGIFCWPLAIVLILVVIVLSTWLFSRRGQRM